MEGSRDVCKTLLMIRLTGAIIFTFKEVDRSASRCGMDDSDMHTVDHNGFENSQRTEAGSTERRTRPSPNMYEHPVCRHSWWPSENARSNRSRDLDQTNDQHQHLLWHSEGDGARVRYGAFCIATTDPCRMLCCLILVIST